MEDIKNKHWTLIPPTKPGKYKILYKDNDCSFKGTRYQGIIQIQEMIWGFRVFFLEGWKQKDFYKPKKISDITNDIFKDSWDGMIIKCWSRGTLKFPPKPEKEDKNNE